MHEQHAVYRVESSARWNLHPGPLNTANPLTSPRDAAYAPPSTDDSVLAEMNRQRETTERVMQEATRLAQSYSELQKVFTEMKNVARNNALIGARLVNTEQRVAEFQKDLQKLCVPPSPATDNAPAFVPESPDAPKP
jgi:septal ring factor EnvC (AmiA/AmiB activator)